jgi:hypothetical protein
VRAAAVRVLRALHTALGRWLALADQPAAVVKPATMRQGARTDLASRDAKSAGVGRARTGKSRRKRGNQHTAVAVPSARKGTSWFDLDPGTLTLPKSADEEESEAWYRAHFRVNGQPVRR